MFRSINKKINVKWHKKSGEGGFTLIEFLIYSIIVTFITGIIILTGVNIMGAMTRITLTEEVNHNGKMAMNKIMNYIRIAEEINSPAQGASANSLFLIMPDIALYGSIEFKVDEGELTIKRGDNDAIRIITETVNVSNFNVKNVSYSGDLGAVRVEMTIEYSNPSGREEYDLSKTFYVTENIRK